MNEEIKKLYKQLYAAMINKDEYMLDKLHDESFVLVHMTGMRQSKEEYIKAILNGVLNYYSAEHEEISVKTDGETAELIGKSKINAAVFGGGKHTWRLQLYMKLERKKGEWLFTHASASTYCSKRIK